MTFAVTILLVDEEPLLRRATALLVAMVTVSTLFDGEAFAGWARPAGVAVGALAAWRRAPFILVVVLAAATTAGLRAVGVA